MIQEPTSIQLLDAAVEQEREMLGRPEPAVALASLASLHQTEKIVRQDLVVDALSQSDVVKLH
jgi:hypothetical protein